MPKRRYSIQQQVVSCATYSPYIERQCCVHGGLYIQVLMGPCYTAVATSGAITWGIVYSPRSNAWVEYFQNTTFNGARHIFFSHTLQLYRKMSVKHWYQNLTVVQL